MRKYYRLILFSVALLSVITMLVYRYKYHHLQSIMNMLNFFPTKAPKCMDCSPRKLNYNMSTEIIFSSNHWTELFDGIYIYSPHVFKSYIFILAFSKYSLGTDLKGISCHLWFENQATSVKSKITVNFLEESKTHFYFECWFSNNVTSPNAVTFVKDSISITVPVFHKQIYTGQYAACVNSPINNFSDLSKVIEFLAYHSHIGIKHFLIYFTTFSNAIKEVLVSVADKCGIIIEFLPWITPPNYERNSLNLQPFMIDCIFHLYALNHSDYAFQLDFNNFVVLREIESIKKLLYDTSSFDYIKMERSRFCLEYPNDIIAEELNINFNTLLKTKVSTKSSQNINVIYNVKHLMSKINQIKHGFKSWILHENLHSFKMIKSPSATLHSYLDCGYHNSSGISFLEDKKMWSFKQVLFESCINKFATNILGKDVA